MKCDTLFPRVGSYEISFTRSLILQCAGLTFVSGNLVIVTVGDVAQECGGPRKLIFLSFKCRLCCFVTCEIDFTEQKISFNNKSQSCNKIFLALKQKVRKYAFLTTKDKSRVFSLDLCNCNSKYYLDLSQCGPMLYAFLHDLSSGGFCLYAHTFFCKSVLSL